MFTQWAMAQEWWSIVEPAIRQGCFVVIHVGNGSVKGSLVHKASGGMLTTVACSHTSLWHVALITNDPGLIAVAADTIKNDEQAQRPMAEA
jgi:hypothetical protein